MKNILILVPTGREAAYFASRGLEAHICGVGMAECAATTAFLLAERLSTAPAPALYVATSAAPALPQLAVLVGVAGAYPPSTHSAEAPAAIEAPALPIGEAVVVDSETVADLGRVGADGGFEPLFQKTYAASFLPAGFPVVCSNTVNTAGGLCSRASGVAIENMEGAAFFAVCERFGVRAMELRTISNRVGEPVTAASLNVAARALAEALGRLLKSLNV